MRARVLAALLAGAAALYGQPQTVERFERVVLTTLATTSVANPFADVKLRARFTHPATGRSFDVPVVCARRTAPAGVTTWHYPVVFMPPLLGGWQWQVLADAGGSHFSLPVSGTFACVPGRRPGPWRPDMPGHPFAVRRERGDGAVEHPWSLTSTYFTLFNPVWTPGEVAAALDHAEGNAFTRVRVFLTNVTDRTQQNARPPGALNHTVFERLDPHGDFQTSNLDFERFDLAQWDWIDTVIQMCEDRDLAVSVNLTLNAEDYDYEEEYLNASQPPATPPAVPTNLTPMTNNAAFQYRYQLYYWYVIGRLCTWPGVQYSMMHEYNQPPSLNQQRYPHEWVRWYGQRFVEVEPYLHDDVNAKIMTTTPRRGTYYSDYFHDRWRQLCLNVSGFLTTTDDSWRSCIGLSRGGELGATSVQGALMPPGAPNCMGQTAVNHHQTLVQNGTPRPIFIEEEWVARNDVNPYIAYSFSLELTPYAWCLGHACTPNPNRFPFIDSNQEGLRKYFRDAAWTCGIVCQGYLSWIGPQDHDVTRPITTTSAEALRVAAKWARTHEWWRYAYDPALVNQAPAPGWYELNAVGARSDHGPGVTRYVVYNPAASTTQVSVDLSLLSSQGFYGCWFMNPDTGARSEVFSVNGGGWTSFRAPSDALGENGEAVLFINVPR